MSRLANMVYTCMDDPGSSGPASCWGLLQVLLIFTSTIAIVFQDVDAIDPAIWGANEIVAVCVFTVDYLGRLFTSPDAKRFVLDTLNLIDLMAILPFFALLVYYRDSELAAGSKFVAIRLLRLARIVKLIRFSNLLAPPIPTNPRGRHTLGNPRRSFLQSVLPALKRQQNIRQTLGPHTHVVVDSVEAFDLPPLALGEAVKYSVVVVLGDRVDKAVSARAECVVEDWESQMFAMDKPLALRTHGRHHRLLHVRLEAERDGELVYHSWSVLNLDTLGLYAAAPHKLVEKRLTLDTGATLLVLLRLRRKKDPKR